MDQGRIAGGWHQLHYCCSLFRRLSRCNCSIFCRSHCKLHLGSDIFKRGHKCSANSTINIWVFWDFNNRTPWLWLFNWFCLCTPGRHRLWHLPHPVAAHQEEPQGLLISQMVIAAVITTPLALWHWPSQNLETLGLLTVSGASSMLGNLFLILAYARAPATQLAPFIYFQLISALFLGWILFDTLPDGWGLLGLGFLLISGFGSAFLRR
jgi:uncharacterized membrane protein